MLGTVLSHAISCRYFTSAPFRSPCRPIMKHYRFHGAPQ